MPMNCVDDDGIEIECPTCGTLCSTEGDDYMPVESGPDLEWSTNAAHMAGAAVAFGLMGMAEEIRFMLSQRCAGCGEPGEPAIPGVMWWCTPCFLNAEMQRPAHPSRGSEK